MSHSNFVLKQVLAKEENIDILKDIIEGILNIKIDKITLQTKSGELFENNMGIANVKVTTKDKEKINVGIQIIDGIYIQHKMILYYAQIHSNQVIYEDISRTITINIVDDDFFEAKEYYKISKVSDVNSNIFKKINEGELHILQLPKFNVQEINTKEEAWIQYFKNGKICGQYSKIQKLDDILNKYWKDEII